MKKLFKLLPLLLALLVFCACTANPKDFEAAGLTLTLTDEKLWDYVSDTVTASDDPLAMLADEDLRHRVRELVEQLPPRCRSIFKACMYEGMDYQEIAERESLSVSTVRVQMKIAVDKLHEQMKMPLWLIALLLY